MIATFKPGKLRGAIDAPPSKSMSHRHLIGAALSGQTCTLTGVDYNRDVSATMECLRALGARVVCDGDKVTVEPQGFMQAESPLLNCGESGSTLRFFIPLALCLGKPVTLTGSERLLSRPLGVYESLCEENGFSFQKDKTSVTVCGRLKSGAYTLHGDVSSQFITGMILALVYLGQESSIEIPPPFESRSYVELTLSALRSFGAEVSFADDYRIEIKPSKLCGYSGHIEGDYSNAAFLDAFNMLGSEITVGNLNPHSLQGDRVYKAYFEELEKGTPTLDISDCPDLGPVLFALASLKNGATFTGTDRLKLKESDRGAAMHEELAKLGGGLIFGDNTITVPRQNLCYKGIPLDGHNDHRIVMAMSVILSVTGGCIHGAEAVSKSFPRFFDDLQKLGAEVSLA